MLIQGAAARARKSRQARKQSYISNQDFSLTDMPATLRKDAAILTGEEEEEDVEQQAATFERFYHSFPHQQRGDGLMDLTRFKLVVGRKIDVLFLTEDIADFAQSVNEDLGEYSFFHFEIVRRLVQMALDRKERECELASRALCALRATQTVSLESLAKGFERLFELADDLVLDNPSTAKDYLARFVARAVVDEVLPPAFLMDKYMIKLGGDIVTQARSLLSVRFSTSRLSRIWGPAALLNHVEEEEAELEEEEAKHNATLDDDDDDVEDDDHYMVSLKAEIRCVATEFLLNGDVDDAAASVARLNAPHYLHELVKRAVCLSLDGKQRQRSMVSTLLFELHERQLLDGNQVKLGFQRLWDARQDLELDTPGAIGILRVYFDQAVQDGVVRKVDLPK